MGRSRAGKRCSVPRIAPPELHALDFTANRSADTRPPSRPRRTMHPDLHQVRRSNSKPVRDEPAERQLEALLGEGAAACIAEQGLGTEDRLQRPMVIDAEAGG